MSFKGILSAFTAASFFGLIPTLTKIAYIYGTSPEIAIMLRYLLAVTIILIPLISINKNIKLIKKHFIKLFAISIGSIFLTTGLLISVIYIPVSLVALIFYTYPLMVVIFTFMLGKKLNLFQIGGFILAFIGLGLALGPSFKSLNIIGILLAFLAAFGASIVLIVNEYLAKHFHAIFINAFVNIVCLLFFSFIILFNFEINFSFPQIGWIYLIIAALCYCIAFYVQLIAVKNIGSSKTSLLLYLEPLVAIVSAVILLKESLSATQIIGTSIVILAIIVTTQNFRVISN